MVGISVGMGVGVLVGVATKFQAYAAGLGSVLPAVSRLGTVKVCVPRASPLRFCGLTQVANAPASSWHSKLAMPEVTSEPVNENDPSVAVVEAGGVPVS